MISRLDIVLEIAKPTMRSAAGMLRRKDANTTGKDDMAADAITFAIDMLDAVQNGEPIPDLPASLRPKPQTDELSDDS